MTEYELEFEEYKKFLNKWFYKPPVQAVELALTLYTAHFCLKEKPIWCQMLGPSSMGKSRIIMDPMKVLPHVRFVDTINKNTFLSGWKGGGLLNDLKEKQIFIIFPDFSTFLGLDEQQRSEVQGQFRRYADMGTAVTKDIGNANLSWDGKMSVIAACTPAIEKYWTLNRDLGERFISYKLPFVESISDQMLRSEYARKQIGMEQHINESMQRYVKDIVGKGYHAVDTDISKIDIDRELDKTAILVTLLRRSVDHTFASGKRVVTSVSASEGSGRLTKQLTNLAVGNAMLWRYPTITQRGIDLVKDTALFTIPVWRYRLFAELLEAKENNYIMQASELRKRIGLVRSSFDNTLEDMEAMEVIEVETGSNGRVIRLGDEMIALAEGAKMNTRIQRYSALMKNPQLAELVDKGLQIEDDISVSQQRVTKYKPVIFDTRPKPSWKFDRDELKEID